MDIKIRHLKLFNENSNLIADFLDKIYPVGSIFWTEKDVDDGGDPNELFPGRWVRIKDAFLRVGDFNPDGQLEGERTAKLDSNKLPKHTHSMQNHKHSFSCTIKTAYGEIGIDQDNDYAYGLYGYCKRVAGTASNGSFSVGGNYDNDYSCELTHNHDHTFSLAALSDTAVTGDGGFSGESFSIMPPYYNKYCWKRVE